MAELDDLRARIRADFAAEDSAKPLSPEHEDLAKRIRADFQADKDRQTAAMNVILEKAATFNPDKSASVQDLATKMELPVDYVERNEDAVRRQNLVQNTQRALVKSPVLAMQLTDPEFAKIAYDNVQSLGGIEEYVGAMARYVIGADPKATLFRSLSAVPARAVNVAAGFGRVPVEIMATPERMFNRALGRDESLGWWANWSSNLGRAATWGDAKANELGSQWSPDSLPAQIFGAGAESGVQSAVMSMGTLAAASWLFGPATGIPATLLLLSAGQGGASFTKSFDAGKGLVPSLIHGGGDAAAEWFGEKFFGLAGFAKRAFSGASAKKLLAYELTREPLGEMGTQVWQNFNEWQIMNPEKSMSDFLDEQPMSMAQAAVGAIVGGGAQVGAVKLADRLIGQEIVSARNAQFAEQNAQLLDGLVKLAASDKVLARNPESFQTFLQAMNPDEGPAHTLYFQASDLQETGVAQQLAQVSPSIAAQLPEALQTGGVVAVPVDEVLTNIAPTEYAQALVDIARVNDPTANNRREANEYRASEEGQALNEYVERQLAERQDDDTFTASRDAVKAQILADMNAVGRFSKDKNEVDAMAYASYYAVRAAQMGVTPEELYARRRVLFAGRAGGGFEQALAERPPKGWVHSSSGQDAAALFNGQTDAQAVFWTDLQGKLAQDAPALAGYSHSIDRSRANNIRGQHGDAKAEESRGQIAVTGEDFARIPEIVTDYDAINADVPIKNEQGNQTLRGVVFVKKYDDGVVVYTAVQNRKRKDLRGATMWKYPPTTDAQTALKRAASDLTSETLGGMAGSINQGGEFWQSLWHGTPHRGIENEGFKLNKIGTGEGAQAYGWGIYGAESRRVADGYAWNLGRGAGGLQTIDGQSINDFYDAIDRRAGRLKGEAARAEYDKLSMVEALMEEHASPQSVLDVAQEREFTPEAVEWFKKEVAPKYRGPGQLYSFEIPDDTPLLDWDKPLSEQPEKVREALVRADVMDASVFEHYTGQQLYENLVREHGEFAGRSRKDGAQAASEYLQSIGIHGLRYLDGNSRSDGKGSHNYVIWDEALLTPEAAQIQAYYQSGLAPTAQALAQWRASLANMSPRNLDYAAKMDAPAVLQAMGVSARRLELPTRYLLAIHEKHPDVPQSVFENLPALLADPLFVYPHKDGGLNVVIDTKTADGDTIVVGVRDGRIRTITPRHGEGAMPVGLASALERRGTRIYARNKEALANARAASTGAAPATIAMHRDSRSAATITTREHIVNSLGGDFNQKARGSFNPETLTVSLLKGADLSTALHEGAHFFFENDIMLASEILAGQTQGATILPGEQEILNDVSALLKWHGIQGDLREQLAQWFNMSHEEKTAHHERTAESFERYLLEGKAPSLELQPYFQKFRAWMLSVYKSVRDFLAGHPEAGKLDDEVRQIFDRMLATSEQIKLAEESRSLMPLFTNPAESGVSVEDQGKYQSDQREATATAIDQLQARVLKDQQWRANARAREIKRLQRRHKALRAEMQVEARRQVLQAPIYRVYQFLTNKIGEEDKLPPVPTPPKATTEINPARDTLIEAIAKLGGISRESAGRDLGVHSDDYRTPSGVFGKPVFRKTGGLDADSMAELLAEHGYLRRDEHGKHDLRDLEDRVTAALGGSPEYSAFHEPIRELRPGEQAFGLDEIGAGRLDLGALQEMYGSDESPIQTLKSRRLTAKNGLHPDIVAELFGFDSGDQLARALASVPTLAEAVQAATDQLMLERHGDLSTPEAIERAADMAVHNEARARLLAAETNALEQAVGKPKTLMPLAKQYAADIVARLTIRNLLPGRYTSAETRAAKLAKQAHDAGDLVTAAAEKRNQMVQHYAARATYAAQDEVDAGLRYLRKFLRRRPKSLDADYAEQIEALLERYDLRQSSNKETDRRKSLRSWVMSQVANGEVPDIAMELLAPQDRSRFIAQTAEINEHGEYVYAEDGERAKLLADYIERSAKTSWRDLSVEQFRGLVETVKQIEHIGQLKNRLLTQKEGVLLDAVKDEIDESIRKNALKSGKAVPTRDDLGRRMQAIKRFGADHIRMAIRALVMDGGKDLGPMFRYFIQPANQAEGKQLDMRAAATERLNEIVTRALNGVPVADRVLKGRYYESVGASLNWQARFAILLNMGNEGNMQRLLSGGLGGRQNIALQDVMPILSEFTAEQLKAAQEIWDLMDSYRPELAELERETKGKEPEWIEPRRLTIRSSDGQMVTLRGGYFPVVYDPALNQRVADQQESEEASRAARAAKARSVTQQSFTKARANEVNGRPLLLTLDAVFSGIEAVIHDLSFRRYSIDAGKLLRSKRIQDAIREHYGAESIRQLRNFVDDLVAGPQRLNDSGERASSFIRQNVSASGLALNVVNWTQQPFGIHNAVVRLGGGAEGAKWVGLGMVKYMKNPVAATREAMQASAFMKNRPRTRFRELNEIRNKVQFEGLRAKVTPFMMSGMVYSQLIADTVAWHAARARAVHENPAIDDESLIAVADQVVRDSQGGGEMVDLSAIERGSPMMKLFTVFFNFQNTGTNLAYLSLNTRRGAAKRAVDMFMVFVMPVLVNHLAKEIFRPGDDDKDKDEILKKLLVDQLTYLTGSFAFVREINTATEKLFGEGYGGYQGPSGLRPFVDLAKLAEQANQGEMDDAMRKAIVNMAGDVFGAPSAAINRAITGAQALHEGKTENPLVIGFGFKERR